MRVMVLVKANRESEAGVLPDQKILEEMGKFNEELVKPEDFGPALTPELRKQEKRLRKQAAAKRE